MSALLSWAADALLASAVLIVLVLLLRVPVRRMFGAQIAYALWALPVLRLVLPPLPAAVVPSVDISPDVTLLLVPDQLELSSVTDVAAGGFSLGSIVPAMWAAGAAVFLGWHLVAYLRFSRRMLRSARPVARVGPVAVIETPDASGPLAFGILRRYVAFPADFASRYDPAERDLALAHELGHHARGDLLANWLALVALALHWFNPVAWFAFRAFRADQEMANDARVLVGCDPAVRHAYACAIVKAASGGALGAACHLHRANDLKGRLRMLGTARVSHARTLAGGAVVTGMIALGLGVTASGGEATASMRDSVEIATEVALAAPLTPETPASPNLPAGPLDAAGVTSADHTAEVVAAAVAAEFDPEPGVPQVAPVPTMASVPPLRPVPPMPPLPSVTASGARDVQLVRAVERTGEGHARRTAGLVGRSGATIERDCARGSASGEMIVSRSGQAMVLCRDGVMAVSHASAAAAQIGAHAATRALAQAILSLQVTRARIAANATMPHEARRDALDGIDEGIADLRAEMDDPD